MNGCMRAALALALLAGLGASPLLAAGPIDGELGAVWWANDFTAAEGGASVSSDGDAPGYRAELWFLNRYGVRASLYSSDPDELGVDTSDYTSVDLMWRALSPTENNYLAVGAGWQEMNLTAVGLDGDTAGARLSVEGRIGLPGPFYVYGHAAYLPSLDDTPATDPALGRFEDLSGHEVDLGVSWTIVPLVALRAGYRTQTVDFTRTGFVPLPGGPTEMDGEIESEGFLIGLGFRF